jgi:hypothetical protein
MKVLLQNKDTWCFLSEDGRWVGLCDEAKAFSTTIEAINHSIAHHLQNVQMLLHFDFAPRYDIVIGLGETPPEPRNRRPRTLVPQSA